MPDKANPAFDVAIKKIAAATRDQYDGINDKFVAGQIDGKELIESSSRVRADAVKQLMLETASVVMKDAFNKLFDKMLATGGPLENLIPTCSHGRQGRCPECNTEALDRFHAQPGTITIQVKN